MSKIGRLIALSVLFAGCMESVAGAITIGETQTNVKCFGANTGAINLNPTGGTAPYNYVWNNGTTTQNRTNLVAGTYDVTVTDNTGATAALDITITQPPPFVITVVAVDEHCGGQDIGSLTLTVAGGTPGYTYLWNDGATTLNRTNLTAAVYYITVTDANDCTVKDSGNVTQPPGIGISANITEVNCGLSDGAIGVTVQFGNPVYTYRWSNGSTLQNLSGLAIGDYTLTVTDALGCTATATEDVTSLPGSMTINTSSTPPVCSGGSDGTAGIVSIAGSAGPYTYLWSNGNTTANLTGLSAGAFSVTVTSGIGCTSTAQITVTQPPPIDIQLHAVALTCFESGNGAINATVSGGVPPYSYNWTGGMHMPDVISLSSATYVVTVTDAAGCTATASVFVPQPLQLTATAVPSPLACSGGASGSVITFVTGGTPVYTYWWGAGITSQDRINVDAGDYSVTVTDGNGCTASASADIPTYTPLNVSATEVNNVCFEGSTGSVNAVVTDGLAPFSFAWSTGSSAQNISNLADGTYDVTVTDAHGCSAQSSATITGPPFATVINSTIAEVSCNGGNNGSISIVPENGNAPYTYNWGAGITVQNRTSLFAGNYQVTVTDNSGCTSTESFNISQPTPIVITPTNTNVTCFGMNNGGIDLNVTGSFAPYTYRWNNGATTQNRTNLAGGNYVVTVTDNRTCTATASINITEPSQIIVDTTVVNLACNGTNTGAINLAVSGGAGGYSYNWGGGIISQNRTNLAAGTYNVTVTDNTNCSVSSGIVVNQPAAINNAVTVTNVSCNGGNNGSIVIVTTGGVSPYTYNWGAGITTQNRTNLTTGNYSLTVTDFSGCTVTKSVTITAPAVLAVRAVATNISCNGANNGSINITVTGGTLPYTYNWGAGITTPNRVNLSAGNYSVTVTDVAGCTAINSQAITQPAALNITATQTNVLCNGSATGAINITVTGGAGPYNFNWGGGVASQNRTNLAAGSYTVTVTDNAGCTGVNSSTITQPASFVLNSNQTNEACNGGSTGAIDITVTGSTPSYTYNWGGGVTTQNRTNVPAGNYTVSVTDANNCTVSGSFVVTQPAPVSLALTPSNVLCFGQPDGDIHLTVTGGTSAYTYLWSDGSSSQNLIGINAGNYSVTVTDAHLCTASSSAVITQPTQIAITISSVQNASCNSANGSITVAVNGGTPGYAYLWNNNSTTLNIAGIGAGTYTLTVVDANLCTATGSATVSQPELIAVNTSTTDVSCFNGTNGQISTQASGGTMPYNFNWSNAATTAGINNLPAATYVLTVTDASNCSTSVAVNVTQPANIVITATAVNITCSGANNGVVNLNVTGGTGLYNFIWSNGATSQQISNLPPNTYSVTVTDANACTAMQSAVITSPPPISITAISTNYACAAHQGAIHVTPTGTAPFSYNWGGGITTQNRTNLAAGTYSVTLTDANLCTATNSVVISAIPALALTLNATNESCFGGANGAINLSLAGGTIPYVYSWSNNATSANISNLTAAQYQVVVTDSNNCSASASASVTQPEQIQISSTTTGLKCFGANDGGIDVTVTGGTPGYTYDWSNNLTTQNISGLYAGSYQLTVTDTNSCTAVSGNVVLNQPTQITVTSTIVPIACSGLANGAIQLTVNGGTAPYNFLWNNGGSSQNLSGLALGNYSVTVTDLNGCTSNQNYTVNTAPPIWLTSDVRNVSCAGLSNGAISVVAGGGTPGYTYSWKIGTQPNLTHLEPGTYDVTVTDTLGCSAQFSFNVAIEYQLEIQAGPSVTIKQSQETLLSVTANVDNGNTYTWTPSTSLSCSTCDSTWASPLQTTVYTVYAVDSNGCKASAGVTVDVNTTHTIFIPNAFTPNGDGNNDEFQIFGDIGDITFMQVALFDRWGEKVFESNDPAFKWDGSFKGQPVPEGVYVYMMQVVFGDGSKRDYKGSETLLR